MIDLQTQLKFSEEQALLLESATNFCRDNASMDTIRSQLKTDNGFDSNCWQQIIDLGWTSIGVPDSLGRADIHVNCAIPVLETMGKHLLSTPLYSNLLSMQLLLRGASAQQQSQYIPQLIEGKVATLALLERNDWGATLPETTLTKANDGYELNGCKMLVLDAQVADFLIVSANHNNQLCWIIIEANQADNLQPHQLLDETKRASNLSFNQLSINENQILPIEKAKSTYRDIMLLGALFTAAEATGSSSAALNTIVSYLQTRKQFGKYIGSYQALKHPTVEILMGYNECRSLIYSAASSLDHSSVSREAEVLCRMAKTRATQIITYAGDRAVQFHGGMGFTYECDAQLFLRRAQWSQQQFGDETHHKKRLGQLLLD